MACVSTSNELLGLDANGTTLTCVAMGVVQWDKSGGTSLKNTLWALRLESC